MNVTLLLFALSTASAARAVYVILTRRNNKVTVMMLDVNDIDDAQRHVRSLFTVCLL